MELPPSQTLYINNINEKIKKNHLKKMLYMVFSQYGRILEITACKGLKLRGQAWIVFQDVGAATKAHRGKQGFNFFDKPLTIAFAKTNSHILARKERGSTEGPGSSTQSKSKRSRERDSEDDSTTARPSKEIRDGEREGEGGTQTQTSNKILFAQNLPEGLTEELLRAIFQHCTGLLDVRIPPGEHNAGRAFLEFSEQVQASMALKQLHGFQLTPTHTLDLSFLKN